MDELVLIHVLIFALIYGPKLSSRLSHSRNIIENIFFDRYSGNSEVDQLKLMRIMYF